MYPNQRSTWWYLGEVGPTTNCHATGDGGIDSSQAACNLASRNGSPYVHIRGAATSQFQLRRRAISYLICVSALLQLETVSFASMLYRNTNITFSEQGTCSISQCIVMDDVLVPDARNPGRSAIAIQQLAFEVGVTLPGETVFDAWYFGVQADGRPTGSPIHIATETVVFSEYDLTHGSGLHVPIVLGDGASTLTVVTPNFRAVPGYQLFYIGLTASQYSYWLTADGPDVSLDSAYFFHEPNRFSIVNYQHPLYPRVSMSLEVLGQSTVPEPAAWILSMTGLGALLVFGIGRERKVCLRAKSTRGAASAG